MTGPRFTTADLPAPPPAAASPFSEIGLTGLKRQSGYIYEEFLPKLQGDRAAKIYEEMQANSPMVGATLFAIDMLMRQVSWKIEPFDDSDQAAQDAQFVDECLHDMSFSWADTLSEIFSMVGFGWSYHEVVYKRRQGPNPTEPGAGSKYTDGRIGWRKWAIRAQVSRDRWEFDEKGGIRGMWQQAPPTYARVFLPIQKCLLFRPALHKNNPEGRSALRTAYRAWYFAKRIEEIEAIGIERDLAGLPVLYAPPEIMKSDAPADMAALYTELKNIVRNIRRDEQEGVILPLFFDGNGNKTLELTLLSSGGKRNFDTNAILGRYDQRIAMTMLADFILIGHEKVGSFALSSDKTNIFGTALGSWLDSTAEVANRHAIPRLFLLNGMPVDRLPKLVHGDIETPPLPEIADFISKLATAGMTLFPDLKTENRLRGFASLPELSQDEYDEREARLKEQQQAEQDAQMALIAAKTTPQEQAQNVQGG